MHLNFKSKASNDTLHDSQLQTMDETIPDPIQQPKLSMKLELHTIGPHTLALLHIT